MLAILLLLKLAAVAQKPIYIFDLRVDYKKNPLGIDNPQPKLSWKLGGDHRNIWQTAYELRIAESAAQLSEPAKAVWHTGKVLSNQSIHIAYAGKALQSKKRYYWQVRVWNEKDKVSAWSEIGQWEMGLLNQTEWKAHWIETEQKTEGKVSPVPIFEKNFVVKKPVQSARLYITAHGVYEASLNGVRVGDDYFSPGWTTYQKRLQYQVYDVTKLLKQGENKSLVAVGDGWYRGFLQWSGKRNFYGKEVGLLYQLEITYADKQTAAIVSDSSWRSTFNGPIVSSSIYNGETIDFRKADNIKTDDISTWQGVRTVNYGFANLVAMYGPPVVKHENIKVKQLIITPKGETVLDFGQNLVGWVQVRLNGKAGDTIQLQHAEVLDKAGNFYTDNLRTAKQENTYILSGKANETAAPHFTFQGFRYVKIKGYKAKPNIADFTAVVLYSDMPKTGSFTSSDSLINQLQHNIAWGQRGNFLDVPTDCPQRDERLGWTGDAQVFFNTAAFNRDVSGFFTKWMADVSADQYEDGRVPAVVPVTQKRGNDGSAGWADVVTIIPWHFYMAYGDTFLLERQYPSMKKWVDYIQHVSENDLWNKGSHYGDWLFYTMADDRDGKAAITDKYLIAQAFYAASTQNLINAAKVLGKHEDEQQYSALLQRIKTAFNKEYVTPSGRLVSSSQTAYVLALQFDLLPENLRQQAADRLAENIKSYKYHITTGFLGTPYICHVLTRFGYVDIAYQLLLQKTYPSWLYPVTKGATTIWERWDGIKPDGTFQTTSMNSFNHYAYGAIGDWLYKVAAGINYEESGYKKIRIAPQLGGDFTSISAKYESLYGTIQSAWKIIDGKFILDVVIPPNTTANILLPRSINTTVLENGVDVEQLGLKKYSQKENNNKGFEVGSGNYHFEYVLNK